MSRRNLTRTIYKTLTRASGAPRRFGDAQAISSADSWSSRFSGTSPAPSRQLVNLNPHVGPSSPNEVLRPNLHNKSLQQNLKNLQQDLANERLNRAGSRNGSARYRAEQSSARRQPREDFGTSYEGAHAMRASSAHSAPDLASTSHSQPHPYILGVTSSAASINVAPTSPPSISPVYSPGLPSTPPINATQLHTSPLSSASSSPSPAAASAAAITLSDDEEFSADVSDDVLAKVYKNEPPPDVFIVNTLEAAKRVAARLASSEFTGRIFACDTEVMDIDVTKHSPCCHGRVLCFSVYCGPDVDFSGEPTSPGTPLRSMLWVDTYLDGDEAKQEEAGAIIEAFRPFFEASDLHKVWHNYSFDRHVMERLGIHMAGFDGDTMHMARLWDSSRTGRGGYSLEALSCTFKP